ncbi:MAG: ECF transporter S component [Oscillospiraceae bacterium]|jgi:riboflavin transporter FmnP|nr:ECF transporter S component [Oscillospiraceae bacterium]
MPNKPKRLILTSLLSAVAAALFFLEFPLFPAAAHLKLDFSDLPALFAGILLGPGCGVAVELIKNLIELAVKGVGTQLGFGNIMNFAVGCAFVLPFALLARFRPTEKRGAGRLAAACALSMFLLLAVGVGMNLVFTPLYFRSFLHIELPRAALYGAVGYATALNAIKGAILCAAGIGICGAAPRFGKFLK